MKFIADKKYLLVPVNDAGEQRKLFFYIDGKQVFELDIKIDLENPAFIANIDIARFAGKELEVVADPALDFEVKLADDACQNTNYNDLHRPTAHFTVREGWLNDPNGMVEYTSPVTGKKTYHMFFQYNPCSMNWGNMHWGHAISDDMVHWTQVDTALFPDETGTMFSGSAIVDKENRAGFKTDSGEDPILLFYTAAGNCSKMSEGVKFTQCLAYSTDGGVTFTKYENNPIIGHIEADNRDPKVIWCEELGKYLLALFLDRNDYVLFTSDDFKHWEELQRIVLPFDGECPDFYPLTVEETGERKWILSGASHRYLVGEFVDGKFAPSVEARYFLEQGFAGRHGFQEGFHPMSKTLYYGHVSYASQSLSDVSDGRRINVAWDSTRSDGVIFNSQMGVPMVHTLHMFGGNYYLCANPIAEYDCIYCDGTQVRAEVKNGKEASVEIDGACDALFTISGKGDFEIAINDSVLSFDQKHNIIKLNGNYFAPIKFIGGLCKDLKIRMIVDECTIEFFNNKGEVYGAYQYYIEGNTKFTIKSSAETSVKVLAAKLANIHA